MKCPKCNKNLIKNGVNQCGTQRYLCRHCGYKGTLTPRGRHPNTKPPCKICGNPSKAKGLCNKHYKVFQKIFKKKLDN